MDAAEYHRLTAALAWQVELGATEAIGDTPVNRYELAAAAPARAAAASRSAPAPTAAPSVDDPVAVARHAAAAASDLPTLRQAMADYPHCELRKGARNLVFADGTPGARVMLVGEAPGRDEDRIGRPFVGAAGQLLDRMLAAIGLDRTRPEPDAGVYITNVLPWRPPENRDPTPEEVAMMRPFLERHITLAAPEILVLIGNHSAMALLRQSGITRLRGNWTQSLGLPVLPMLHPAYLLRNPVMKRHAWADLLDLKRRLFNGRARA